MVRYERHQTVNTVRVKRTILSHLQRIKVYHLLQISRVRSTFDFLHDTRWWEYHGLLLLNDTFSRVGNESLIRRKGGAI